MLRRPQFSLTKLSASHCYRLYAKYAEINQNVIDWQTKPWRCKGETLEHSQKMTHLTVQCCYETIWDAVRQKKKKNGAASRWNLESWAPKIHKRADWSRPLQARGRPGKGCNALAIQQTRIKHAGLFFPGRPYFSIFHEESASRIQRLRSGKYHCQGSCGPRSDGFQAPFPHFQSTRWQHFYGTTSFWICYSEYSPVICTSKTICSLYRWKT